MIGDRRIVERSYGKTFLAALGPMPVVRDSREIASFFEEMESDTDLLRASQ